MTSKIDELSTKIGQLLWISNNPRPNSCNVSILATKVHNATINKLHTMNKLIYKVKHNQYKPKYQQLGTPIKSLSHRCDFRKP